jgi:RNA polymerase sigma-70 factor (ECF subfamily)
MDDDLQLIQRLRAGDEQAFAVLVRRYQDAMLRLAASFVPNAAIAEEVVQDTWIGVLRGIAAFEGRATFKTWIFSILVNRARSTGVRERRSVALADVEPAVAGSRFGPGGQWTDPPRHWADDADDRLSADKLADRARSAISELPDRQRQVVTLRDIDGLSTDEVCQVLQISEGNQRVLLHRGRSRVRQVLENETRGA